MFCPAQGRAVVDVALGCNLELARYLQGFWQAESVHPPPQRSSHGYRPETAETVGVLRCFGLILRGMLWHLVQLVVFAVNFFEGPKPPNPTRNAARPRRYEGQHDESEGQSGYGYSQSYGYGSGYGGSSASGHQGWSESWIHVLPAPVPECLNSCRLEKQCL